MTRYIIQYKTVPRYQFRWSWFIRFTRLGDKRYGVAGPTPEVIGRHGMDTYVVFSTWSQICQPTFD